MSDEYKKDDVGLYNLAPNTSTGAGFFDAAISLDAAVKEGDQVAIGIGSAGMALETLGMVLDPIGSLLTAGIGWIIEHVSIFRWPLDMMYGHPEMIAAAKEAIDAEKAKLEQWSTAHQEALDKLMREWSGNAADQFKKNMEAVTAQLATLGGYVEASAKHMQIAGGIVGAFRGIVRDMIAMVLATIIKGALIAAALAPITFGASIVFFVGTTIAGVAVALAKIASKIAQLTAKLGKLLASIGKMGKAGDDLAGAAPSGGAKPPGGGAGGGGTPPPPKPADPTPAPPKPTDPPPAPPAPKPPDPPPAPATPKPDDAGTPPPAPATPKPDDSVVPSTAKPDDPGGAPPAPKPADPPPVTPPPTPKPDDAAVPPPTPKPVDPPPAPPTPKPVDPPPAPATPKPDDGATPPSATPKPADPPPATPPPATPKPDDAATPPPKPDDPAGTPPKTDEPKPNPNEWEKGKPLSDQLTQVIKDKLAKVDGVTPETLKKFDHLSNLSVDQLKKIMPDPWAEKFEGAVKVLTDPWYGKSGLAGKTIVDLIKGVPASINNSDGEG
ncbi:hypothetical protein [Amycolatopsis sp.]|uniref:hypothetical protein n=1 Tax=Amycolatopsis sp. TaxID=37632 RepID=UPI002DFAD4C8|nr:hypothetical protein [Amycolatopsis sp.]